MSEIYGVSKKEHSDGGQCCIRNPESRLYHSKETAKILNDGKKLIYLRSFKNRRCYEFMVWCSGVWIFNMIISPYYKIKEDNEQHDSSEINALEG